MRTLWGHRRQAKEEKGRKKREKDEREGEGKEEIAFALVLAEGNHHHSWSSSTFFKVIPCDFMLQSSSCMCFDIIYIDSLIYFIKKVGAFEVLNLVFISDLNTVFLPKMF